MKEAFLEELKRIEWEFEEEQFEVEVLRDYGPLTIESYNIALKKGEHIVLPLWLIGILEEEGYVKYKRDQEIDFNRLMQIAYEENRNQKLVELNTSMFIKRVKSQMRKLEEEKSIMAVRKLTSIRGSFHTIMRSRMKKIVSYAQSTDRESRNKNIFSPEEEWLYYRLRDLFDCWTELQETDTTKSSQ